jgi:hypothetical protein
MNPFRIMYIPLWWIVFVFLLIVFACWWSERL